jgi:hypothetical protein
MHRAIWNPLRILFYNSRDAKLRTELEQISLVDVVLPTRAGISIRKRCVSRPTDRQAILLQRLGLEIPIRLEFADV